jgi:hypothetical protein
MQIAKSSAIAASIPGVNALEPISPELVLVDPELARVARARLPERETSAPDLETTGRTIGPLRDEQEPAAQIPQAPSVESPLSLRPRRRVAPVLLTISLMANAILIAVAVAGARDNEGALTLAGALRTTTIRAGPTSSSSPSSTTHRGALPAKKRATAPRRPARRSQPKSSPKVLRETSGQVERKILNLVIQSPSGKLPPALIDSNTGLAKNGLQAVCTPSGSSRSFLCLVRPAQHKPAEGLYVRYRVGRGGAGVFTWYRYRTG